MSVAPFAGAWIEMQVPCRYRTLRGVAPFAGAWIEIEPEVREVITPEVAPFAGAWIEIKNQRVHSSDSQSLPSRERGLK